MKTYSFGDFYDQLRERAAHCAAEEVRKFSAELAQLDVRSDAGHKGDLRHLRFTFKAGAKEYPVLRIIAGYETPLSPGWIQFKPGLKEYDALKALRSRWEQRMIRSELFRPNPSDGVLFYEVRITDLDRPFVSKGLIELTKWLVSQLKRHHPVP